MSDPRFMSSFFLIYMYYLIKLILIQCNLLNDVTVDEVHANSPLFAVMFNLLS